MKRLYLERFAVALRYIFVFFLLLTLPRPGLSQINVLDHGAKGDGFTLDISAIQAAIDRVNCRGFTLRDVNIVDLPNYALLFQLTDDVEVRNVKFVEVGMAFTGAARRIDGVEM